MKQTRKLQLFHHFNTNNKSLCLIYGQHGNRNFWSVKRGRTSIVECKRLADKLPEITGRLVTEQTVVRKIKEIGRYLRDLNIIERLYARELGLTRAEERLTNQLYRGTGHTIIIKEELGENIEESLGETTTRTRPSNPVCTSVPMYDGPTTSNEASLARQIEQLKEELAEMRRSTYRQIKQLRAELASVQIIEGQEVWNKLLKVKAAAE
uniref:Uncharacterized protein n=1 Tax=Glossina palpalis gambiensis TaxID=67801 RepID=A0A1B0AXU5_9MUSC